MRSRRPQPATRPRSALRGVAVALVAVGYVLAMAGTGIGQGWALLAHETASHQQAVYAAPQLAAEGPAPAASGVTTLRHSHGGHTHAHEAPAGPMRFAAAHTSPEASGAFHEHGGVLHRHDAPADDPAPVATVSLDDHRLLAATALPAPLAPDADRDARGQHVGSFEMAVETPPPIG